jgi:hypothetical protein
MIPPALDQVLDEGSQLSRLPREGDLQLGDSRLFDGLQLVSPWICWYVGNTEVSVPSTRSTSSWARATTSGCLIR